ncbi:hypothetical protein GR268_46190, partial [Rhizobium leguminosarum]|nr:hypothetical protein [Rhizobium leguminosarum]
VNGDGKADIIIGLSREDNYNTRYPSGASYIVYGSDKLPHVTNLYDLGNGGIMISGDRMPGVNYVGSSVSSAGDVNGDGIDDVIVAAFNTNTKVGASYIVYGNNSLPSTLYLSSLGSGGVTINGDNAPNEFVNFLVSSAGDVNGDGKDDV